MCSKPISVECQPSSEPGPANSLIRSYVGKAYYEENTKERDKLAGTQFGLAKQLDPKDPTTWGKVPRNAPCPCGSGKKYKHCHGRMA